MYIWYLKRNTSNVSDRSQEFIKIKFLLLIYDILVICWERDVVAFGHGHTVFFENTYFFCKIVQIQ